jgi:hypothetical protein
MALVYLGVNNVPTYTALSTDISSGRIAGANLVSRLVYLTDTAQWKFIYPDLTLGDYLNLSTSGGSGTGGGESWAFLTSSVTNTLTATDYVDLTVNQKDSDEDTLCVILPNGWIRTLYDAWYEWHCNVRVVAAASGHNPAQLAYLDVIVYPTGWAGQGISSILNRTPIWFPIGSVSAGMTFNVQASGLAYLCHILDWEVDELQFNASTTNFPCTMQIVSLDIKKRNGGTIPADAHE